MKTLNIVLILSTLTISTSAIAASDTDKAILNMVGAGDGEAVNYTLPGKQKGESVFETGILPSAIGEKEKKVERENSYKVFQRVPVTEVPTRSVFRNGILPSAKGMPEKETGTFSRFELKEEQ